LPSGAGPSGTGKARQGKAIACLWIPEIHFASLLLFRFAPDRLLDFVMRHS